MRLSIGVEEICKNCSLIGFTNFGKGFEEICKGYLQFPPELVYLDSVHLTEFYLKVFPFGEPFSRSGNFTKTLLFRFSPFGETRFFRIGCHLVTIISLFSIWRNPIFLSVPKTGDGIFINVAAGMMLVFYVLYVVYYLFLVCYLLYVIYALYTIYCVLIMFYTLYIV